MEERSGRKQAPRTLYRCPCRLGVLPDNLPASYGAGAASKEADDPTAQASSSSSASPPLLPSQSASARYEFHPLPLLYFCADCLSPRCSLCAVSEIVTYYCPSCLFEVPSASVKAERNRCPRNCFLCPNAECGGYLNVIATDPESGSVGRLESAEASVGRPPYFLTCMRCKWDSKHGFAGRRGYQFEKPTGISAQLDSQRGAFAAQTEMDNLRSHFEAHIRRQNHANSQGSAAASQAALTASLSKTKLMRDVPDVAKFITPARKGASAAASLGLVPTQPPVTEDLPQFQTCMPSGGGGKRDPQRQGKEQSSLAGLDLNALGPSLVDRYQSGWDSGSGGSADAPLRPLRVPLQSKRTLRCPSCRHILIKPDPKATSHRWKIKLAAMNYLPEINVAFKGLRGDAGSSTSSQVSTLTRRTSALGLRESSSQAEQQGIDALDGGRTYEYELCFRNPLEDVIAIQLSIAQAVKTPAADASKGTGEASTSSSSAISPSWSVRLSTSKFSVNPYDDVDGVIDDELLSDPRKRGATERAEALSTDDLFADHDEDQGGEAAVKGRRSGIAGRGAQTRRLGIVRKKGNETVIALRLESRPDSGSAIPADGEEVEIAVHVTFTYRDASDPAATAAAEANAKGPDAETGSQSRSLSFWSAIRLGRFAPSSQFRDVPSSAAKPRGSVDPADTASQLRAPIDLEGKESPGVEDQQARLERLRRKRSTMMLGDVGSGAG